MAQFVDEKNLFLPLLYILSCATHPHTHNPPPPPPHTHTHTHTHTHSCFSVFKGSEWRASDTIIIIISPSDGRCVCAITSLGPFHAHSSLNFSNPQLSVFFHHKSLKSSLRLVYVNELCCDWLTSSHVKWETVVCSCWVDITASFNHNRSASGLLVSECVYICWFWWSGTSVCVH